MMYVVNNKQVPHEEVDCTICNLLKLCEKWKSFALEKNKNDWQ